MLKTCCNYLLSFSCNKIVTIAEYIDEFASMKYTAVCGRLKVDSNAHGKKSAKPGSFHHSFSTATPASNDWGRRANHSDGVYVHGEQQQWALKT
ncbi:MAG: hypothetical protein WBM52_18860 [Thiogranum sp.]